MIGIGTAFVAKKKVVFKNTQNPKGNFQSDKRSILKISSVFPTILVKEKIEIVQHLKLVAEPCFL